MEAVEKVGGLWCVRLQSPSTPVACREATKLLLGQLEISGQYRGLAVSSCSSIARKHRHYFPDYD